jgi:exopolyphosphatase / guanosine-5'-triphosphate,3'-diphosphate pyrophosphatase
VAEPGTQRRAVIDVGTNSVKLLVADVAADGVTPVHEASEQTRLGRGFYETHELQPGPVAATAEAVARYAAEARALGAPSCRVLATSAAREARNAGALLAAIRTAAGLETEVISGGQEAAWGFRGVASEPALQDRRLLVLDVGGGSTEFILGRRAEVWFRASHPLGGVRLLERLPPGDPPAPAELARVRAGLADFLAAHVTPALGAAFRANGAPETVVGVGGTPALLAHVRAGRADFDRALVEGAEFGRAEFQALVERLWALPLARRRALPGLPPERADVILMGAAIFEAVLTAFDLPALRASTRGLRFGALLEPAAA